MNIFVFSDESGVFDVEHNDFFVFGGVIYFSKEEMDNAIRKYKSAENNARKRNNLGPDDEAKATAIDNTSRLRLFQSLRDTHKFGVVIRQKKIHPKIFEDKKTKQRYLDYAFKISLRRKFERLIARNFIKRNDVENIHCHIDQHSTATNGKYELRESLESEFKYGTFNHAWNIYHPPVFPGMNNVTVKFMDSRNVPLIRASDIVANRLYYYAVNDKDIGELENDRFNIIWLP